MAINPAGEIAGYYWDTSGGNFIHGFLRIPAHPDE